MGAMCIGEYRFEPSVLPTRESLERELEDELGRAANDLEPIEVTGDRVRVSSMSAIVLLYAAKVCQRRGGRAVSPCADATDDGLVPIPTWAETPWKDLGFFRRLRVGWVVSLQRVPIVRE